MWLDMISHCVHKITALSFESTGNKSVIFTQDAIATRPEENTDTVSE